MKFLRIRLLENHSFIFFLLFLPIIFNFVLNYFSKPVLETFNKFNYFDFFSSILLFYFLLNIGISIKTNLNLPYISTGIVIYFLSYFVIDSLILFFYENLTFNNLFFLINILWFFLIALSRKNRVSLLKISITYFALNVFNNIFYINLTKNKNVIGDVKDIHYDHVSNIYQNSYFYSVNNPTLEGYPQITAYFQAVLNRISISLDEFQHLSSSINVLYFLVILLIFEIDIRKSSKYYLATILTALIYNSEWLKLIFVDSLMTEGMLNYLFCSLILSGIKYLNSPNYNAPIIFFSLGLLYLCKQFISLLALISIIMFFLLIKDKFYALFGLSGIILKQLSHLFYFENLTINYHLKEIDLVDTFFDLILLRDLKLENISLIIKNLYLDKPTSLVFFLFFLITGVYYFKNGFLSKEINTLVTIILINFLFVFILYVSIWRNMELESPIRYMHNLMFLILITEFKIIETFEINKN